jgi:hypothetical protein
MSSTNVANARAFDDLESLEKKLDGFVRNIRATAVTKPAFPEMSPFGDKADVGWARVNVRF